jgi:hypothetical protein
MRIDSLLGNICHRAVCCVPRLPNPPSTPLTPKLCRPSTSGHLLSTPRARQLEPICFYYIHSGLVIIWSLHGQPSQHVAFPGLIYLTRSLLSSLNLASELLITVLACGFLHNMSA